MAVIKREFEQSLTAKFFSLLLIYLLGGVPLSIVIVNVVQLFYFQPNYFILFSSPRIAIFVFMLGLLGLFLIFAFILYMSSKGKRVILGFLSIPVLGLSGLMLYFSFDNYKYVDQNGLHVNPTFSINKTVSYTWGDMKEVIQVNKGGSPVGLEFILTEGQSFQFPLSGGDWVTKRRPFYETLSDHNVPLSSREK